MGIKFKGNYFLIEIVLLCRPKGIGSEKMIVWEISGARGCIGTEIALDAVRTPVKILLI
jgi:hypothetical protein